jgi:hypothetical protein
MGLADFVHKSLVTLNVFQGKANVSLVFIQLGFQRA